MKLVSMRHVAVFVFLLLGGIIGTASITPKAGAVCFTQGTHTTCCPSKPGQPCDVFAPPPPDTPPVPGNCKNDMRPPCNGGLNPGEPTPPPLNPPPHICTSIWCNGQIGEPGAVRP